MTTSLPVITGRRLSTPAPTAIVFGPAGWMSKRMVSVSADAFAALIAARSVHS
jgi:hypothetical protein